MAARTWLARAVAVALTAQVGLIMTGVYLDQHRVDAGTSLDASSYMNNAGSGLGWLAGSVLAPVLALALLAVAGDLRRAAGAVLALTLLVFACSAIGRVLPVLGLVQGAASCTALGVCVWLAGRSEEAVSSRVATLRTGAS